VTPVVVAAHTLAALDRVLGRARRRWRGRRVLEGVALALASILFAGLAAILIMDASLFEPGVVSNARTAVYAAGALALLLLVLRPLLKRAPDEAIAHYVESRVPHLDALVLSAVEASAVLGRETTPPDEMSPALARRLIGQAARECEASPRVVHLEQERTRRAVVAALIVAAVGVALLTLGPDAWRHGASLLFRSAEDPAAANPYVIQVTPGDVSVLAGDDVRIAATTEGFELDRLVLASRVAGDDAWARTPLSRSADSGVYETFLFDVTQAIEYRVEHPVLRTSDYTIEVISRPVVSRIDLLYEFPEHTGRAPELVTGGGDIAAVSGTRVEVRATPSRSTPRGRLVLDGERFVEMHVAEDGQLRATLEISENGRYRSELEAGDRAMAPASPEHAIVAYADALPTVALVNPGRDVRVTSIEEIEIEARAQDDVAVRDLELVISVNGGADEVVQLVDESAPRPEVAGQLELFLEERGLAPGDLIAYYVRARDASGDPERQVSSDIFFMDVRPFEVSYRRASGAGAGGGGRAGAQQEDTLSAQQRSLVVAMFKLLRDRASMDDEVFTERVETLATAQSRIRTRVDAIVRRLGARSIVELNPGYRRMAKELPEASKSMLEVEALLAVRDVEHGLPAARQALLHLQRADAAFREVQVAQARRGGGGSAGSDLANLFRLEMDRFRNKYEDVRRGDWRQRDRQLDETMRKLRELAERQQREVERARLRAQRGASDSDGQRALAEEVEKLLRELKRLTRRRSSQELRDSLRELENAARAMRRSADGGDARAGAEALDRLREARRLLESEGPARLARDTEEARRRADTMAESQGDIAREVQRLRRQGEGAEDAGGRLADRKQALATDVKEMESRLDRLAERAGRDQQAGAAKALKDAAEQLRSEELAERIRRSADRIARDPGKGSPQQEDDVTRSLRMLRSRIASASGKIGEPEDARISRIVDRLRGNMRGLERDQERIADRARRRPALSTGDSRADGSAADLADTRRALEQRAGAIGGLAEVLAREPELAGDLDALLAALDGARQQDDANAGILAERHAALLAAMKNIERELRSRQGETPPTASASARAEPPPSQRAVVEAYYRNLSEKAAP
jgi:hypothetical protein